MNSWLIRMILILNIHKKRKSNHFSSLGQVVVTYYHNYIICHSLKYLVYTTHILHNLRAINIEIQVYTVSCFTIGKTPDAQAWNNVHSKMITSCVIEACWSESNINNA
jgi:hypothetical protein